LTWPHGLRTSPSYEAEPITAPFWIKNNPIFFAA
jgi:hypothetical protein